MKKNTDISGLRNDQIVNHIIHLIRSTKEFSSYNSEIGLRNFAGEIISDEMINQIKEEIKQTIIHNEKRFCLSEIEILPEKDSVIFRLHGDINDKTKTIDFLLEKK